MKKLVTIFFGLIILAIIISSKCFGQNNANYRLYKFNNVATPSDTSASVITGEADGYLWYDITTNNFRAKKKNGTKFSLGSGAAATLPATLVGFGSGTNTLTGNPLFTWETDGFHTENVSGTGTFVINNGKNPVLGLNDGFEAIGVTSSAGSTAPALKIEEFVTKIGLFDFSTGSLSMGLTYTTDASNNLTSVFTGKHSFTPTATLSGLNVGALAGNPSTLVNADMWYNSTTGFIRFRAGGSTYNFLGGNLTANQIGYAGSAGTVVGETAFTYDATNNVMRIDNLASNSGTGLGLTGDGGPVTLSTSTGFNVNIIPDGDITLNPTDDIIINSALAVDNTAVEVMTLNAANELTVRTDLLAAGSANYIQYNNGSDGFAAELALRYDPALNVQNIDNVAGTATTSTFGGEIQLDDITNSDDLTLTPTSIIGTGRASFTVGTVSTPLTLKSSSGDLSVTAVGSLLGGVYNPTGTNVTNVTTTTPDNDCVYTRIGNNVIVSGIVNVTPTAASGEAIFDISLPIASNLSALVDCTGTFSGREQDGSPVTQFPGQIFANTTNDRAQFRFASASTTAIAFSFQFQYIVK